MVSCNLEGNRTGSVYRKLASVLSATGQIKGFIFLSDIITVAAVSSAGGGRGGKMGSEVFLSSLL